MRRESVDSWNYDVQNVPDGDARKIVTLEKDGMTWVGIRAFHHADKKWLNGGAETDERVVAWQDLPQPADPRCFPVPKEMTEEFRRAMQEDVIPEIERRIHENAERAAKSRTQVLFR